MTAEELLQSVQENDDYILVDPVLRELTVPDTQRIFGVYQDKDVERKYFKCPKVIGDDIDLTTCYIFINYLNTSGIPGQYLCSDITVSGNDIIFSWLISANVFGDNTDGIIQFAVQAKRSNEQGEVQNVFNTKPATGVTFPTIEAGSIIQEEYADIILQLLTRMDAVHNGYTFTPTVDVSGNISWTNDGGLPNPQTVNIKGGKGDTGTVFVPTVTNEGVISWTNDGGLPNPETKSIVGPRGYSGLVPSSQVPYAASIIIPANEKKYIETLQGGIIIGLGEPVSNYDNEWVFVVTIGNTAYNVSLPDILWQNGVAPVWAANTITEVRLFYKGNVLCGVWL